MNRLLHKAARNGDLPALKALLLTGADVNERGRRDRPLLISAIFSDSPEVIRWLLEQGADVEAAEPDGKNALHLAAMSGKTEVVRLLLDHGSRTDARDQARGDTPFHLVAAHASGDRAREIMALFLERGVSVDIRSRSGVTPLIAASWSRHDETLRFLLDHGADIDAQTLDGRTALMTAARGGIGNEATVGLLLQAGARPDIPDADGRTALMYAATATEIPAARALLDGGAAIDLQDGEGKTALIHAAGPVPEESVIPIVQRIAAESSCEAPWLLQILADEWEARATMGRLLLEKSADPRIRDHGGRSALDWAHDPSVDDAVRRAFQEGSNGSFPVS